MTKIELQKSTCAICGSTNEYHVICSTNTMGPPDLDLRPAEMHRSTMPMWVQWCPDCGYCAGDITRETPGAADIMKSDAYQQIRSDDAIPGFGALLRDH